MIPQPRLDLAEWINAMAGPIAVAEKHGRRISRRSRMTAAEAGLIREL